MNETETTLRELRATIVGLMNRRNVTDDAIEAYDDALFEIDTLIGRIEL